MRKSFFCIFLLIVTAIMPLMAQRKAAKKGAAAESAPKENFSLYTDNPICQVVILDSVVVPIDEVISKIPMPKHLGKYSLMTGTSDEYYKSGASDGYYYENDFGDQRWYVKADTNLIHNIYRQTLLGNNWSEPEKVTINGEIFDIQNPFPMPDGQTLYFAGCSFDDHGADCLSLYTTTFDPSTNSYLIPQRMPFPFSSASDDLFYIEDEIDSVAWLATTRRQPEGMACIYTMQCKKPWVFYDADELEPAKLKSYAIISNIADTWTSAQERDEMLRRINDNLSEHNNSAATSYSTELGARKDVLNKIGTLERQLDEYRRLYSNSNAESKLRMANTIAETEKQLEGLYMSLKKL